MLFIEFHCFFISRAAGKANALDAFLFQVSTQSIYHLAAHTHTLVFGQNVNVKMGRIVFLKFFLTQVGCGSPFVSVLAVAVGTWKILAVKNPLETVKVFGTDYVADSPSVIIKDKAVFRLMFYIIVTKRIKIEQARQVVRHFLGTVAVVVDKVHVLPVLLIILSDGHHFKNSPPSIRYTLIKVS